METSTRTVQYFFVTIENKINAIMMNTGEHTSLDDYGFDFEIKMFGISLNTRDFL